VENERLIGRVVSVESQHAMVELEKDLKSLHKSFYSGVYPIARINSYVVMPIGSVEIVGIVTRVSMSEDTAEVSTKAVITLSDAKRLIRVTMLGTLKKKPDQKDGKDAFDFSFGISEFPALDNPVYFVLDNELDAIFDKSQTKPSDDKDDKTFYLPIGKSGIYKEYQVKVDPDSLFSRHLAVLGNTGSGKSCTIAQLIQTILRRDEVKQGKQAHFVIFDTNGEYHDAFEHKDFESLTIGRDGLRIPYWFMNFEDWIQLIQPKEGSQIPVLSKSLLYARNPDYHPAIATFQSLKSLIEEIKNHFINRRRKFSTSENDDDTYKAVIKTDNKDHLLTEVIKNLIKNVERESSFDVATIKDVDMPTHFDRFYFRNSAIDDAIDESGSNANQIRSYCETMLQRIDRYFTDPRYDFLFHNFSKDFGYSLATFIRLCLGRMENSKIDEINASAEESEKEFNFVSKYSANQKEKSKNNFQIIIFDLSLIPSDVLNNITALLGRLILEFSQRIEKTPEYVVKEVRGKFPIVLILEEAHNYIPQHVPDDKELVSKKIFERIAREGRKYGISLVVSSQRPSELSETVLSQCNSFIVHRIQNPRDQEYIKNLVPSVSKELLDQLPILAQRTALVFGDCVRAPAQVVINEVNPKPKSHDPKFWDHWTGKDKFPDEHDEPNFEKVCKVWEGSNLEASQDSTSQ